MTSSAARAVPLRDRARALRIGAPPLAVTAAGTLAAWLIIATGFANYDTFYAIVWGSDLAHGRTPDFDVSLAPTPHPLATLLGFLLAPLGEGAETAWVVLAFLFLGALAGVTYALGRRWFNPAAGAVAAALIVTREPVLSFGARAYVDIPYLVLVLVALAAEARRPRAGLAVLVPLALAGLLRPEAWLFSGAYLAYLWWGGGRPALRLFAVAAAAPLLWLLSDWLIAGDPLHSLTGTRDTAQLLERRTGLDEVPLTVPRRLGEILREDGLIGATLGVALSLVAVRRRTALPIAAGIVALAAFCVLAAAGLPILGRYLLLPATLLAIFCGAAVFGWSELDPGDPWRRRWQAAAVVTVLAIVAFTPLQVERLDRLRGALHTQRAIHDDLHDLAGTPAFANGCRPVAVPNHRAVPLLALWLDLRPSSIVSAQLRRPSQGQYVDPATARVERNFILDKNDPGRLTAEPPRGFRPVERNASWVLYERCVT